jgi:hypothetical protein
MRPDMQGRSLKGIKHQRIPRASGCALEHTRTIAVQRVGFLMLSQPFLLSASLLPLFLAAGKIPGGLRGD